MGSITIVDVTWSASSTTNPRIDQAVGHVDDRVDEQVAHRQDEHATLQHREVFLRDRLRDGLADTADAEEALDGRSASRSNT